MPSATESASRSTPRIFRGWWIVGVAIIGQTFGLPATLVYRQFSSA